MNVGVKLHLGCGVRYIPGFVHIDALPLDHVDHVSTIDRLSFIEDDSVDLIYNCHVLEHFRRQDVEGILCEWARVLKPGGILRTSVPDFNQLTKVYAKYGELEKVIGPLFGRGDYLYNIHYNVFDLRTLTTVLDRVGFVSIREYDWRDTEHADVDDYASAVIPHMDRDKGIEISLNVEAIWSGGSSS